MFSLLGRKTSSKPALRHSISLTLVDEKILLAVHLQSFHAFAPVVDACLKQGFQEMAKLLHEPSGFERNCAST